MVNQKTLQEVVVAEAFLEAKDSKEDIFIDYFKIPQNLKDDGAYIDGFVYSKDAFFEDVHFKSEWMSLFEIAQKAMLVNISDAIVMNSYPKYALLSVAIPSYFTPKQLKELSQGFINTAKKYNIKIIGGDTIANTKLDITITLISTSTNPIYRTNIKKGDLIAYTGELGSVKKDLKKLINHHDISSKSKFIKPQLKDKFFYRASKHINSALDISDGLSIELQRLSRYNDIGYKFFQKIKKSKLCSGEEYEILFGFSPNKLEKIKKIAKKTGTKITIIAKAVDGSYTSKCKNHHFN